MPESIRELQDRDVCADLPLNFNILKRTNNALFVAGATHKNARS